MPGPRLGCVIATVSAAALALSSCSTPYVVNLPEPDRASATSMEKAMKYLDDTRKVVRGAVASQITDEQNASNAFLGVGALVAGLALGKVHRDAVIGTAAVAGTGYALTNNNLPRYRLDVHTDSLDALNCAERAATPLDITDTEKVTLTKAVDALKQGRLRLDSELRKARVIRDSVPNADVWRKGFPDAESAVATILAQASQSSSAGEAFLSASSRGAVRLNTAVRKIGDDALTALGKRSPLAQLPALIQGLAKDIGGFAPGSNIDSLVAGALKNSAGSGVTMNSADTKSPLETALEKLELAAIEVAALQGPVNTALRGRNTTFDEDAFKDCNVSLTVSAFVVSPASLRFLSQEGGQRVLEISGGIRPYFIQQDGTPIAGLTFPNQAIRSGDAEIVVKAGSATSGAKTGLRIVDSSAAQKGIRVEVEVVAAPAAASTPAAAPSAPAITTTQKAKTTVDGAVAALKKVGKFTSGDGTFERKSMPVKAGDRVEVAVTCTGSTATFKRADLVKAYLKAASIFDFPADKVSLTTDPPSCLAEAAAAPSGAASATVTGTPKINVDGALSALKNVKEFSSGGAKFALMGSASKNGGRIDVTVTCPAGNTKTFTKLALVKSYLSMGGAAMDFPAERVSLKTEPASCAPS